MKHIIFLFFYISGTFLSVAQSVPRQYLTRHWDSSFGSINDEELASAILTKDGGYLLGGNIYSGLNLNRRSDYLIIKTDTNGKQQWIKRFGGDADDYLKCILATPDGGYLLGGTSSSGHNGDKSKENQGESDFWLIKINANGNKEWDSSYGGNRYDGLTTISLDDGDGYLIGGTSFSDSSGNRTAIRHSISNYWIIKIDFDGHKLWDKCYGSGGDNDLASIIVIPGGGYFLTGTSISGESGDRSTPSRGLRDYWVIEIDRSGKKGWDNSYGGKKDDILKSAIAIPDGYLLGGASDSDTSGEKSENSRGGRDFWIVQINTHGTLQWDRSFGGDADEDLISLINTTDGNYLVSGTSSSGSGGDRSEGSRGYKDFWTVLINSTGNKILDKRFGGGADDELHAVINTPDGGYLLAGTSISYRGGDKFTDGHNNDMYFYNSTDFWIVQCGLPVLSKCGPEGCMTSAFSIVNPQTGNVRTPIRDLEIWGGAGDEPLVWMRYGNSQEADYERNFGTGHNWIYGYQYDMKDLGTDENGRPLLLIHYPEGQQHIFVKSGNLWQPLYAGVNRQIFQNGNEYVLQKANGFMYRFLRYAKSKPSGDSIYFQLQDFQDSHQNLYKLSYNSKGKLSRITEPAGRFLDISYTTIYKVNEFFDAISKVTTSDGRSIKYSYTLGDLISAVYQDETSSYYTYQTGDHLLKNVTDPHYEGSIINISYTYLSSAPGFIKVIKNGETNDTIASVDASSTVKTITYCNGRKLVYNMPSSQQGQIKSYTDGLGSKTEYEYTDAGIGYPQKITDASERVMVYNERTKYGNPLRITYPDGSVEAWTRNEADQVMSYTNQLGQVTTYTRNAKNLLTRIDYYDGSFETFTNYNQFGQAAGHVRRNGGTEQLTFSSRGLMTGFTDAENNTITYAYDTSDRLKKVTDARNDSTKYEYQDDLLTKIIHQGGSSKSFSYDEFFNISTVINEAGVYWLGEYDEFRRLTKSTDLDLGSTIPLFSQTTFSYSSPGYNLENTSGGNDPATITLPSGKKTTFAYDAEWNRIRETTGAGSADEASVFYQYDIAGNPVKLIDSRGKQWHTAYDIMDRLISETDPMGNRTEWTYDNTGRILSEKRADNGVTKYNYDDVNRIKTITDPKNQVTSVWYDPEGNRIKLTDPKLTSYITEFDKLNRPKKLLYPDNSSEKYGYDAAGNLTNYTNRAGNVQANVYDNRNRNTSSQWNDNMTPPVSLFYDNANRLTKLSSPVSTLTYTYNFADQPTSETQSIAGASKAKTTTYSYNKDGLSESIKYPSGSVVSYGYTGRNQIASIGENGQTQARFNYDLNGNRTSKTLVNGTTVKYTYDDANRRMTTDNLISCGSIARFDGGYDNINRMKFVVRNNDKGDAYGYDAVDQLTDVKYEVNNPDGTTSASARIVHYDYDSVGNRIRVTDNGAVTNYSVNSLNQYTNIGSSSLSYTANGSLNKLDGWTYTYDAQNRLTKATNANSELDFAYDANNRCVKRTINGATIFLYYDNWNIIEERNENDVLQTKYEHGAEIDEMLSKTSGDKKVYYHHDALGNVVLLTDTIGNVAEQYAYDAFGSPSFKDKAGNNITISAFDNRFLFTGHEFIKEIGQYDYRNRFYDPNLGRFLQTDPIGFSAGDVNMYRYGKNNVTNQKDAFGFGDEFYLEHKTPIITIIPVITINEDTKETLKWWNKLDELYKLYNNDFELYNYTELNIPAVNINNAGKISSTSLWKSFPLNFLYNNTIGSIIEDPNVSFKLKLGALTFSKGSKLSLINNNYETTSNTLQELSTNLIMRDNVYSLRIVVDTDKMSENFLENIYGDIKKYINRSINKVNRFFNK